MIEIRNLVRSVRVAALRALCVAAVAVAFAAPAEAGSETPPVGPPWVKDLVTAQKTALERKVPIFVYLTKTY